MSSMLKITQILSHTQIINPIDKYGIEHNPNLHWVDTKYLSVSLSLFTLSMSRCKIMRIP